MNCEQASNLFDVYLDGEIGSTLETELLSHLVDCADCRRSLALLEVAGHVIKTDVSAPELSDSFSDRLLACIADEPTPSYLRFRSIARWGLVGLGAAAAVAFAVGALSGRQPLVAGSFEQVANPSAHPAYELDVANPNRGTVQPVWEPVEQVGDSRELDLDDWSRMTVMQLLNALGIEEQAARSPATPPNTTDDPSVEEF